MKNKDVMSAIMGSAFFAIPYLALSVSIVPSLAIGTAAFCAGELVFKNGKNGSLKETNISLYKILEKAKKENKHIISMVNCIDDEKIKNNLSEIYDSVDKIIVTIEKNPNKVKKVGNFFDYYLPITSKIVDRYDEIENQNLSSSESKKFITSTNKMVEEINKAFKTILNSLYQSEIIDTDAEMKVFDSMLKSDGFNDNNISVDSEEDNNG